MVISLVDIMEKMELPGIAKYFKVPLTCTRRLLTKRFPAWWHCVTRPA